jgi:error-prone DNA polymerase
LTLLIRCGALDFTGQTRPALFLEVELFGRDRRERLSAPLPFESRLNREWRPNDYPPERRLRDEWEILGFAVGPPLMSLFRGRLPAGLVTSRDLPRLVGRGVRLAGLVAAAHNVQTEDNRDMQFITLEDEHGLVEVTIFPGGCLQPYLRLGPYLVGGTIEQQYDVITVTAQRFEPALQER